MTFLCHGSSSQHPAQAQLVTWYSNDGAEFLLRTQPHHLSRDGPHKMLNVDHSNSSHLALEDASHPHTCNLLTSHPLQVSQPSSDMHSVGNAQSLRTSCLAWVEPSGGPHLKTFPTRVTRVRDIRATRLTTSFPG